MTSEHKVANIIAGSLCLISLASFVFFFVLAFAAPSVSITLYVFSTSFLGLIIQIILEICVVWAAVRFSSRKGYIDPAQSPTRIALTGCGYYFLLVGALNGGVLLNNLSAAPVVTLIGLAVATIPVTLFARYFVLRAQKKLKLAGTS